ncbi:MAG: hypothetical protein V8R80_08425 [Eubacterium sp.]
MSKKPLKAIVYVYDVTKDEKFNLESVEILKRECERRGYKVSAVLRDDISEGGMSKLTCAACIGLSVMNEADVVLTVITEMIDSSEEGFYAILDLLWKAGLRVEALDDDLFEFYMDKTLQEVAKDTGLVEKCRSFIEHVGKGQSNDCNG